MLTMNEKNFNLKNPYKAENNEKIFNQKNLVD